MFEKIFADPKVIKFKHLIFREYNKIDVDKVMNDVQEILKGISTSSYIKLSPKDLMDELSKLESIRQTISEYRRNVLIIYAKMKNLKNLLEAYLYSFSEVSGVKSNKETREAIISNIIEGMVDDTYDPENKGIEQIFCQIYILNNYLDLTNDNLSNRYFTLKELSELLRTDYKNSHVL